MLKKADIEKHIENHLSDGDELVGCFYAKINPSFLVGYMTGGLAYATPDQLCLSGKAA